MQRIQRKEQQRDNSQPSNLRATCKLLYLCQGQIQSLQHKRKAPSFLQEIPKAKGRKIPQMSLSLPPLQKKNIWKSYYTLERHAFGCKCLHLYFPFGRNILQYIALSFSLWISTGGRERISRLGLLSNGDG